MEAHELDFLCAQIADWAVKLGGIRVIGTNRSRLNRTLAMTRGESETTLRVDIETHEKQEGISNKYFVSFTGEAERLQRIQQATDINETRFKLKYIDYTIQKVTSMAEYNSALWRLEFYHIPSGELSVAPALFKQIIKEYYK